MTISDYVKEAEKKGLKSIIELHSEKSEDDARLEASGLPTYKRFKLPYNDFSKEKQVIINFLNKYKSCLIRALPIEGRSDLPRRPKKGFVTSFEECEEYFTTLFSIDKDLIGNEDFYYTSFVEVEKSIKSGVIISSLDRLLIEIGENLDKLSHGEETPSASYIIDFTKIGYISNKENWIIEGNQKDKNLVKRALKYITLNRDSFNPLFMKGYFEFVVTESDKIKFWDYKINKAYLK